MPKLTAQQLATLKSIPPDGANLLRVALALTTTRQTEICDETGLGSKTVSDIVNGRYTALQVETARAFATFFECQIEDLFPAKTEQSA